MKRQLNLVIILIFLLMIAHATAFANDIPAHGTASLMLIVERDSGSVLVIESSTHTLLGRVTGLGNLTHGTIKFSRDSRYAYAIGRDASVSKIDLMTLNVVKQVKGGDDSVGGVMSQDGKYLALSNYSPGEVRILDSESLETIKIIPAVRHTSDEENHPSPYSSPLRGEGQGEGVTMGFSSENTQSRVVGLVDAPGNLLIFSLMDSDSIWVVDANKKEFPIVRKFEDAGKTPYDALITPDGRYYLAGFLNSNEMGILDTWDMSEIRKISTINITGRNETGTTTVPLWKIPHLKGWAIAGGIAVLPAVQREVVLVYDTRDWHLIKEIPLVGTALYTVASPDNRFVWVDIAGKNGDIIQVIDLKTLSVANTFSPGKGATHPQFTSKGTAVYISLMDEHKVVIYNPVTFEKLKEFEAHSPSGIFSTERIHKFGM